MKRVAWRLARHAGFTVLGGLPRGMDLFQDIRTALELTGPVTAFDVGANVGAWSAQFLEAFPEGRVWCFEPNPDLHGSLVANLPVGTGCVIATEAIGDIEGEVNFVLTDEPTIGFIEGNTHTHAVATQARTVAVQATTLDAYCRTHDIGQIDILKIDTEGSDLKVLEGARASLSNGVVRLVECECGVDPDNYFHVPLYQIATFLEPLGFRLFGLYEQQPEWTRNEPHLRRVNAVFLFYESRCGSVRYAGVET